MPDKYREVLEAFGDIAPEFSRRWERDYSGDYFDVSCRMCGADQPRKGEVHETWCVVPALKEWNAMRESVLVEGSTE